MFAEMLLAIGILVTSSLFVPMAHAEVPGAAKTGAPPSVGTAKGGGFPERGYSKDHEGNPQAHDPGLARSKSNERPQATERLVDCEVTYKVCTQSTSTASSYSWTPEFRVCRPGVRPSECPYQSENTWSYVTCGPGSVGRIRTSNRNQTSCRHEMPSAPTDLVPLVGFVKCLVDVSVCGWDDIFDGPERVISVECRYMSRAACERLPSSTPSALRCSRNNIGTFRYDSSNVGTGNCNLFSPGMIPLL